MTTTRGTVRSDRTHGRRSSLRAALVALALIALSTACAEDGTSAASSSEPWGTNTVGPAEFAKEIANPTAPDKPVVICTAPEFMYRIGHIPGAVLHGPTNSPEGLSELTSWAQTLPRSANLVIYCGCCPLSHCPNLRPAYAALSGLGFTRVRVLIMPNNFGSDWADRGYPVQK